MSDKTHVYESGGVTVTFEKSRCIHSAHCVRHLPAVFNTAARPWVQPGNADAETVLNVVAGCPTGALHATRSDGVTADGGIPVAPVAIQVTADGPLYVRGAVVLTDADDATLAGDSRVALCRCGLSSRKPFCDNSHRAAAWRDG